MLSAVSMNVFHHRPVLTSGMSVVALVCFQVPMRLKHSE